MKSGILKAKYIKKSECNSNIMARLSLHMQSSYINQKQDRNRRTYNLDEKCEAFAFLNFESAISFPYRKTISDRLYFTFPKGA